MISAYWGFVLMPLHLGLHWSMMMGMAKKAIRKLILFLTDYVAAMGLFVWGGHYLAKGIKQLQK